MSWLEIYVRRDEQIGYSNTVYNLATSYNIRQRRVLSSQSRKSASERVVNNLFMGLNLVRVVDKTT